MELRGWIRLSRIRLVGIAIVGLGLSGCASLTPGVDENANRPKNVLFVVADDLRFDLGLYGDSHAITPNLDALAERGMVFNRAYSQQAVCNPSRASMITGLRPDTIRVWDLKADFRDTMPDLTTLPQYFKENGYHVQGIGKIFHNSETAQDPDSWSVPPTHNVNPHWKDWVVPGNPAGPKKKQGAMQCLDVPDDAYWDGMIAADAVEALGQMNEEPFFLAVGFWKPHLPFNAPKKYWDLYDRDTLKDPPNPGAPTDVPEVVMHDWHELRTYKGIPKEGPLTPEMTTELRHGYYAAISYLDALVGKLLEALEREGLSDDTIIVFVSDHGFHLGEHALWGKITNFELDTRVPLIVSIPGQENAGEATDLLVELVDLYPTLADLCGLPVPEDLDGLSMSPLFEDPKMPWKSAAFSQHPRPFYGKSEMTTMGYSIRTDRYRYTEWVGIKSGEVEARELYDHAKDPGETMNVVNDPAYDEIVKQHRRDLRAEPDGFQIQEAP